MLKLQSVHLFVCVCLHTVQDIVKKFIGKESGVSHELISYLYLRHLEGLAQKLPEIQNGGNPDFRESGIPKIRISGIPEFRISRIPEFPNSGIPDFANSGILEFRISRIPEIRNSRIPEFRIWKIRNKKLFPGSVSQALMVHGTLHAGRPHQVTG